MVPVLLAFISQESPALGLRPTVRHRVSERQASLRGFARLLTADQSRHPAEWQEGLPLQVISSQPVMVQHGEQEACPVFLARLSRHQAVRELGAQLVPCLTQICHQRSLPPTYRVPYAENSSCLSAWSSLTWRNTHSHHGLTLQPEVL